MDRLSTHHQLHFVDQTFRSDLVSLRQVTIRGRQGLHTQLRHGHVARHRFSTRLDLVQINSLRRALTNLRQFTNPTFNINGRHSTITLNTRFTTFRRLTNMVTFNTFLLSPHHRRVCFQAQFHINRQALQVNPRFDFDSTRYPFHSVDLDLRHNTFRTRRRITNFRHLVKFSRRFNCRPIRQHNSRTTARQRRFNQHRRQLTRQSRRARRHHHRRHSLAFTHPTRPPQFTQLRHRPNITMNITRLQRRRLFKEVPKVITNRPWATRRHTKIVSRQRPRRLNNQRTLPINTS